MELFTGNCQNNRVLGGMHFKYIKKSSTTLAANTHIHTLHIQSLHVMSNMLHTNMVVNV